MVLNGLLNIEIDTLPPLCSKIGLPIGLPRTTFDMSLRKVAIMVHIGSSVFFQWSRKTYKKTKETFAHFVNPHGD